MISDKKAPGKRDDDTPPDDIKPIEWAILVVLFAITAFVYGLAWVVWP